jgi:tetratricopeptide (TPR) repeat protein
MNRGNACVAQGEVRAGLVDHDRAIELDPRLALAYANRGWARLLLGDGLDAEKDFNKCFELDDALRIKFEPLINKERSLLAEKQR